MDPQRRALELRTEAETYLKAHFYSEAYTSADEAVRLLQEHGVKHNVECGEPVVSDDAEVHQFCKELALSFSCRARSLVGQGELDRARKDHDSAVQILSTSGAGAGGPESDEDLATAVHNRSNCLLMMQTPGALDEALTGATQAIEIRESILSRDGGEYVAAVLAGTYKLRASILQLMMRLSEAETDARKAVEMREELVDREGWTHLNPVLAMTRYTYADILGKQFKFAACITQLEKAIQILRSEISRGGLQFQSDLLYCLSALVLYSQGETDHGGIRSYPVAVADECVALAVTLLNDGRRDLLPLFLEFVGHRGVPCVFKAGDVKRAVRYIESGLNIIEASGSLPQQAKPSAQLFFAIPDQALEVLFANGLDRGRFQRIKSTI